MLSRLAELRRSYGLLRGIVREAYLRRDSIFGRVGRRTLVGGLRRLGLEAGDTVFVHTAFRSIGYVVGGPPTVIAALEEVLGPEGTLLMPAYSTGGLTLRWIEAGHVFDVKRTPSDLGTLPETFRTQSGTLRSLHPTHSVCARGRLAGALLEGHERAPRPFGEGTPFRRLLDCGGKGLILGARLHNFTALRAIEDHLGEAYPIHPYLPEPFPVEVIDGEGRRFIARTYVPDPSLGPRRNGDVLLPVLRESGLVREGRIGKADCLLIRCSGLLAALESATRRGILAYQDERLPRVQRTA